MRTRMSGRVAGESGRPLPLCRSESAPGSCGAVNSYDKSSLTEEKEVAMQKEIGKTAGAIWDALNTTGEQSLQPAEESGKRISPFRGTKRSTRLRRLSKITRRSRVHVQIIGLNAATKRVSEPTEKMSLDNSLL